MAKSYGNGSLYEEVVRGKKTGFWIAEKRVRKNGKDDTVRFRKSTKKEAKDAMTLFLRENVVGKSDKTTVQAFFDNWFAVAGWAATTRVLNDKTYGVHILTNKSFCAMPYKEVDSDNAKSFLSTIKGSENTKHRVFKLLHAGFQTAVVEDSIKRNPFLLAKTNRPKASKADVVSFTVEHERKLFNYLQAPQFKDGWLPLLLLAFDSGCRMAEILGLQFDSFERISGHLTGWVKVNWTLDTIDNKPVLKGFAKNQSSYKRAVRLSRTTMQALAPLLEGTEGHDGYVFENNGQPYTHSAFYHQWQSLLEDAGVPSYHFHSTRHSCATRLLKAGCYIVAVSKRLGHSKPSITLDVYGDCIPSDQDKLADIFDASMATYSAAFQDVPEIDVKIDTTVNA